MQDVHFPTSFPFLLHNYSHVFLVMFYLSSHTKNIPNSHRKNYVNEPKNFQPLQGALLFFKSEPLALINGNEGESFPYSLLQSISSHPLKFNENSRKSTYFFYKPMGVGGNQLPPIK